MNRGHILRELVLEQLKALTEDGIIQINDKLKYNADKNFTDPLDIPSLGYIQALIEQGGSETLRRTFIIPSGTSAPSGVISLVGLTNEQGDQIIPDKALWAIYDGDRSGGQQYVRTNSEVQGLETDADELTVNEVLVVLDGVESEPLIKTVDVFVTSGVPVFAIEFLGNEYLANYDYEQIIAETEMDSVTVTIKNISDENITFFIQESGGYELPVLSGQETEITYTFGLTAYINAFYTY